MIFRKSYPNTSRRLIRICSSVPGAMRVAPCYSELMSLIMMRFTILLLILFPAYLSGQSDQIAGLTQEKEQINKIIDSLEYRLAEIDAQLSQVDPEERLDAMISKYGKNKGKMIASGRVWATISYEMARDSWGEPAQIQKTSLSNGDTQKWTYSDSRYLYFRNGRLESWRE